MTKIIDEPFFRRPLNSMGEYFKLWRRTMGVLTLVIASVFACGWIRSFDRGEILWSSTTQAGSFQGGLFFESYVLPLNPFDFKYSSSEAGSYHPRNTYNDVGIWSWKGCGFAFGGGTDRLGHLIRVYVPYWSVVIPLTVISGVLLLVRFYKSTPQKFVKPIPEGAT